MLDDVSPTILETLMLERRLQVRVFHLHAKKTRSAAAHCPL
jgi:hypothetical protein